MHDIAFLLFVTLTFSATPLLSDIVSPMLSLCHPWLSCLCTDVFAWCQLIVLWFSSWVPEHSALADFCFFGHHSDCSFVDGSLIWTFLALFALARVALFALRFCFRSPRSCGSTRRIFAARHIGHRRYRLSRRAAAIVQGPSLSLLAKCRFRCLAVITWPVRLLCVVALRAASLGELAVLGRTPACRGCTAGDGPTIPVDFAHQNDAWAKYLKQKSQPVVCPNTTKKPEPSERSKWVDLKIDMDQVDGRLSQLSPDSFGTNASGLALLTRQMFLEASAVRSVSPLAVILPGDRNEALITAGINESAIRVRYVFLKDEVIGKFFRKRVTVVQLGTSPVLWKDPSGETDWSSEPHTDFAIHITKKIFEDDWSAFISTSRKEIPKLVYGLHSDLNAETCPFFAWRKLDAETHRASFRAHSKHEKLFLKASGILGPFFIQKICRSDEQKTLRAQETVVQWLPKRSYAEALALVHSFESHIGLVFGNGNYGIRVTTADVAQARKTFAACDPRFADSNRNIVGRRRFEVLGLPKGTTRHDIIANFAAWKNGWHVLPQRQMFSPDGESTWILLADSSPPELYYEGKNCRILVQEIVEKPSSSNSRPGATKRTPTPASRAQSVAEKQERSAISAAHEKRFADIEQRMQTYEARLSETEQRLTTRVDAGFSQIMSQLQTMQAPALPSQGSKCQDQQQNTPHKGGPRKESRTD
jgi:hypothetical protein